MESDLFFYFFFKLLNQLSNLRSLEMNDILDKIKSDNFKY